MQVADTTYEAVRMFGRILIGIGTGQCTVTSLLYIGEVAPLHIRGPALMMFQFIQSISQLIAAGITQGTEGINSTPSYKLSMSGLIILLLMLFAGLPFIPETPTWYASRDRHADATNLLMLVATAMMFCAFLVIGGIGTQKEPTTSSQYVIVVFSFVIIVAFNYGLGPLAYTVAREMAVGPNQNKIMSFSIVFFYFITWLVSFTAPNMY